MAISRVSSGSTSSFSGSYVAGDLIVIHAVNSDSSAIPFLPAGYSAISAAQQSSNSFAMSAFYVFATSASESYPILTNATAASWVIYRGAAETPFVQILGQSGSNSSTIAYSGIVSFQNPGVDWVVTFGAARNNTGLISSSPPNSTSLVVTASDTNYEAAIFDTGAPASSYSYNSKSLAGSTYWATKTAELVAGPDVIPPASTPTDLFFTMF